MNNECKICDGSGEAQTDEGVWFSCPNYYREECETCQDEGEVSWSDYDTGPINGECSDYEGKGVVGL